MKTYFGMWTYIANFSDKPFPVEAASPQEAAEKVASWYAAEFRAKATIMVFESRPVFTLKKGEESQS